MTARETKLLENVLDALDRLFDKQCSAIDVWALLLATGDALRATEYYHELEPPAVELLAIIGSGASAEVQRERALHVTNKLRHYLAELLPVD